MHKIFLICWIALNGTVQSMAQVKKDTVRTEIDYRLPPSSKPFNQPLYRSSSTQPSTSKFLKSSGSLPVTKAIDTLREKIDYRMPVRLRKPSLQPDRAFLHYIGIQLNHVIEPFGLKDNSGNRNPYTLTYGVNQNSTGLGLNTAWGLQSSNTKSTQLPDAIVQTATNKTWFRFGFDIQGSLHQRWRLGMGVDLLLTRQTDLSKTYSNGFVTENRKDTHGRGLGPRISLQYLINSRLRVGTETCLYFEKFKIQTKEKFTGLPAEYSNYKSSDNSLLYPISVFAIVRVW